MNTTTAATASVSAETLERAVGCYLDRQARREHPSGDFDKAGRWTPAGDEECACCSSVRAPTRAYPYSLMVHCRSVGHVAALFGVDVWVLRRAVRLAVPARREGGDTYYKAVAVTDDGRYLSIFDGVTEYVIGEPVRQMPRQNHGGGIYCYPSLGAARRASVPGDSALYDSPRAILRVRAEGNYCVYDNGKLSFGCVTPLEEVERLPGRE